MNSVSVVPSCEGSIEERMIILSIGEPFKYIIPNFEVLAVNMRQVKLERESEVTGLDEQFDAFIRDDEWLHRSYPAYIHVTNAFIIKVYDDRFIIMVISFLLYYMHTVRLF